jgi:hypothetical protein
MKTKALQRIVVLDRGWVLVGARVFDKKTAEITLSDAAVVRRWGTTKGLGQLAAEGPTPQTVLEPIGTVTYAQRSEIFSIECKKWNR